MLILNLDYGLNLIGQGRGILSLTLLNYLFGLLPSRSKTKTTWFLPIRAVCLGHSTFPRPSSTSALYTHSTSSSFPHSEITTITTTNTNLLYTSYGSTPSYSIGYQLIAEGLKDFFHTHSRRNVNATYFSYDRLCLNLAYTNCKYSKKAAGGHLFGKWENPLPWMRYMCTYCDIQLTK